MNFFAGHWAGRVLHERLALENEMRYMVTSKVVVGPISWVANSAALDGTEPRTTCTWNGTSGGSAVDAGSGNQCPRMGKELRRAERTKVNQAFSPLNQGGCIRPDLVPRLRIPCRLLLRMERT